MAARSNGTKKRMADTPFKDHFSKQAAAYQTYRPHYPEALFRHIASHVSRHEMAWDCATGNGQAAHGMVPFFDKIIATDASEKQIEQAAPHRQIEYLIAPAEDVPLQRQSMDLVLVAQALHWFDWPKFYDEVRRVVRPGGLIAAWCYGIAHITPAVDTVMNYFYREIVGTYWPAERAHIEANFNTIPFPFQRIPTPDFAMTAEWKMIHLAGYFSTWSATQRYKEAHAADPVDEIRADLQAAWGDAEQPHTVTWPIHLLLGRI